MHPSARRLAAIVTLASVLILALAASAGAAERLLFSSQNAGTEGLTPYAINLDTGALTQQSGVTPAGLTPTVPGISPDGSRIYVGAYSDDEIRGFSIGETGLTSLSGFPVSTGDGPNEIVVGPTGNSLWSANTPGGSVSAFSVDSAGGLAEVTGSPFATSGTETALAVSPMHSLMFSAGYAGDVIAGFQIGPGTALSPLGGFPLAHPGTPIDVEYNVAGNILFVANISDDNVSSYSIDTTTGALTEVAGSPFAVGSEPSALAASADGKWLFVNNSGDNTIQSFAVGGNGVLTPTGPAVATGQFPSDVSVAPNSRFVYTANYWSGTISGFAIGSDGGLTELADSPFGDASGGVVSIAIVPDQGPIAAFSSSVKDNTVSFDAAASSDPDGSVAGYAWDFGDGTSATSTVPQISHTYASVGSFTASLRVTDNENCSNLQIGTGQTIACNGSARAVATSTVAPIGPLTLKHATGKQLTTKKVKGGIERRVQIEFFLNREADVSYQFQRSTSKGRCRSTGTKKRKPAVYRNFGKKTSAPGSSGRVRTTFTGTFGGNKIVPGRYRVKLKASAASSDATPTTNSATFCVR
jgi:6-phosphogluconolactonase (cycloisomerase 2 family)